MNNDNPDDLAKRLGTCCQQSGQQVVTAESCTGGGLAEIITRIPGSSAWFERGFVTYSNAAKEDMLGVPAQVLNQYGAVSEQTAGAMAAGALDHSTGHISVAITGIAGPGGETVEKPVGTVCLAWAEKHDRTVTTTTYQLTGGRLSIRSQACALALQGLIDRLTLAMNRGR